MRHQKTFWCDEDNLTIMSGDTKVCSYCKKPKLLKSFAKNKNCKDGHDVRCKSCVKERNAVVEKIRLTAPPKPEICDCCKKAPKHLSGRRKVGLVLDHDPSTNTFRGWLCDKCNKAIGMLGDDLDGILNALDYLKRD